jgi:4-hydroxy-tetrahydrodipicolinate reductase
LRILELVRRSEKLRIRGAVDIDPTKVGRDVGVLLDGIEIGTTVVASVHDLPVETAGQNGVTAVHAAGSRLEKVWPQLRELLDSGFSVVSTCEELSFPWNRHPELSREIDDYARERGLSVLGTGVNPGFVMDVLPLCLTATFGDVRSIRVSRAVDVSTRRVPLQQKVGVGMARDEFVKLAQVSEIGHVGLEESARLLAHGLGWELGDVSNTIEPTLATRKHRLDVGELSPGDVDGLAQTTVASTSDGRGIELSLTMRVEVDQQDEITVIGEDQRRLIIPGGIPGDYATAAITANCVKQAQSFPPGLATMAEVGMPRHT